MVGRLDFRGREFAILCAVLLLSTLAGRQLFMDGANFVVRSLADPFWFPQPTPRRFFTVLWETWPVRILGRVTPDQIEVGSFLYGLTSYAEIAIPAAAIAFSKLEARPRFLLLTLFLSAAFLNANFIIGESSFALANTTIFALYTIDRPSDPHAIRRVIAAVLLIASYEIAFATNLILAFVSWRLAASEPRSAFSKAALPALLCLAPPFQLILYLYNPNPSAEIASEWFPYLLAGAIVAALFAGALFFKIARPAPALRAAIIVLLFVAPIMAFWMPPLLPLRTDLYQFAYPARFYAMMATAAIAFTPLIVNRTFWRGPPSILDWFGDGALRDLAMAVFALFCGVSVLASLDAYAFRHRMEVELGRYAGVVNYWECDFCRNPERFGVADLGYPWWWTTYSIAESMHLRTRPAVVVIHPDAAHQPYRDDEIAAFLKAHDKRFAHLR